MGVGVVAGEDETGGPLHGGLLALELLEVEFGLLGVVVLGGGEGEQAQKQGELEYHNVVDIIMRY